MLGGGKANGNVGLNAVVGVGGIKIGRSAGSGGNSRGNGEAEGEAE